jgi:ABC-type uncharacterized transport system permease subunit
MLRNRPLGSTTLKAKLDMLIVGLVLGSTAVGIASVTIKPWQHNAPKPGATHQGIGHSGGHDET